MRIARTLFISEWIAEGGPEGFSSAFFHRPGKRKAQKLAHPCTNYGGFFVSLSVLTKETNNNLNVSYYGNNTRIQVSTDV